MSNKATKNYRRKQSARRSIPMQLVLVIGGVLLIAATMLVVWNNNRTGSAGNVSVEVKGQPSLKVDKETVDLGDVKVNELVSVSFQLSNVGDEPLRLSQKPFVEVVEGC